MKLVIASNNSHKLEEIKDIVGSKIELLRLLDIGCLVDIPETGSTLEANASQKSNYVYTNYGFNCFADDTGLEVDALNGAPGVISARYAGEARSSQKNIEKLLLNMKGIKERQAQFRTVISLIISGEEYQFEGIIRGKISENIQGSNGFGYDPIFIPDGYNESFAQMDGHLKNIISHRGLAVQKLVDFFKKYEF